MNVLVAGESLVSEGAEQLELPVEIVGRLHVPVGHLPHHMLVVVDHFLARYLGLSPTDSPLQIKRFQHKLWEVHFFVVWVERGEHCDGTFINFFSLTSGAALGDG